MLVIDYDNRNMSRLSKQIIKELSTDAVTFLVGWLGDVPESAYFGKLILFGKLKHPITKKIQWHNILNNKLEDLEKEFDYIRYEFIVYNKTSGSNILKSAQLYFETTTGHMSYGVVEEVDFGQSFITPKTQEDYEAIELEKHVKAISRKYKWADDVRKKNTKYEKWYENAEKNFSPELKYVKI